MQELSRSTVAKLLATENISVVQNNVATASFDVKNRVLTLPMWKDTSPDTEDHLIGHEVGHALFTPLQGWHDAVCSKGKAYKSYLNVIEDARIEKLIQRKYPGLRAPFIRSYKKLLADGLFGSDIPTINRMPLIDRINTYFKCGQTVGLKFTLEEQVWLPRISELETWEEVVELTDELYNMQMELLEQQEEETEQDQEEDNDDDMGGSDGEVDGESDESTEDQFSGGEYGETDDEGEEDDDDVDTSPMPDNRIDGGAASNQPAPSQTDQQLRDNINREIYDNFSGEVFNLKLGDGADWKQHVIHGSDIVAELNGVKRIGDVDWDFHEESIREATVISGNVYDQWYAGSKNTVNHMVKEFEMRKSAAEYARSSISKTGVIDTVKMNNYRLTDDIFKRVTTIPEGKNHGFIMYLDMSGSMSPHMFNTVEQTLMLVHFCRQIQVPFRVYGFNDMIGHRFKFEDPIEHNRIAPARDCMLMELFHEKMSKRDIRAIGGSMLSLYGAYMPHKNYPDILPSPHMLRRVSNAWSCLELGGTPLDDTLVYAVPIAQEFRSAHRIDRLNTIFLTDGASHSLDFGLVDATPGNRYVGRRSVDHAARNPKCFVQVTNPHNNKTYKLLPVAGDRWGFSFTDYLLKMYKDVTGSTVIGYRIERGTQREMQWVHRHLMHIDYIPEWSKIWEKIRKEGWNKVDTFAYDECYVLSDKFLAPVSASLNDVEAGSSKSKVRTAFRKASTGSRRSRKLLSDFVDKVA